MQSGADRSAPSSFELSGSAPTEEASRPTAAANTAPSNGHSSTGPAPTVPQQRDPGGADATNARNPWPVADLLVLSIAVFVSVATELLPTGLLPAMSRDLGVSEGRLGLLVTAYALMVALLAAPIGLATAKIGRRRLLVIALTGYVLCNTITAVSDAYPLTVAGRLIGGLSHGLFWGMLAGYAGRLVTPDRIGRAVTLALAGGTAAVLAGVPIGTALGVAFGWRTTFGIFAILALVLTVVCGRLLPSVSGAALGPSARFRDVIRMRGLLLVVTSTALLMLGHFSFITYVAPFLLHSGVPETRLAPALLASGAAGAIGLLFAGFLVDRRLRGAMLASAGLLAGTFVALIFVGSSAVGAVVGLGVTGLALGMLPVFLQAATLRAAPSASDPASALNASAFNIGISGGSLVGGFALDHGGPSTLPILAAGLTMAGLATIVASRRIGALSPG